jgi:hypothetical protein
MMIIPNVVGTNVILLREGHKTKMPMLHHAKNVPAQAKRAHRWLVTLPAVTILIVIVSTAWLSVYLLRQNNLGMIQLRREVVRADQGGDRVAIEQSLQALQHYVARHMNSSTSVDLSASYQRDVRDRQRSTASRLGNVSLYNRAEVACKRENSSNGTDLAQCITAKLSGQSGGIIDLPNPALYRYNFASPTLSLDLAGFTLVIGSIALYSGLHQLVSHYVRRRFPALAADHSAAR